MTETALYNVTVRAPKGCHRFSVTASIDMGKWSCEIESVSRVVEPKPTFEAGKSYRTRDGQVATIINVHPPHSGTFALHGRVAGQGNHCWLENGRWLARHQITDHELDLMPGAIEEEAVEDHPRVDPICVLQGQIDDLARRLGNRVEHTLEAVKHHGNAIKSTNSAVEHLRSAVERAVAAIREDRQIIADRKSLPSERLAEAACEMKAEMKSDVHDIGCRFIHSMSAMWSRTNPGAVVEDLALMGLKIVSK